jgi:hypothetical protein
MIRPPPTVLTLTTDDLVEYENAKKTWPKIKTDNKTSKGSTADGKPNPEEQRRKEVQERIGLNISKK